jgi:hypothetical protein
MKEHLEKVHNWSLRQSEIPEAFRHSYERQKRGWICRSCGEDVGNWHDNRENTAKHYMNCAAELRASFKRMSFEEPGMGGGRKSGDLEQEWPLIYGQKDESCG